MCFSAPASFAAAAVLTVTGVVALRQVKHPSQRLFALIPLLFGVQQLAEGFFWMAQTNCIDPDWENPSVMLFLIFAQVLWPLWVPLSIFLMETHRMRRKILGLIVAAGAMFAAYSIYCLASYPLHGEVSGNHVAYRLDFPIGPMVHVRAAIYLIATLVPPFISSARRMPVLGSVLFISFLVSWLVFPDHLISVWCYFAALISVIVVYVLYPKQHA